MNHFRKLTKLIMLISLILLLLQVVVANRLTTAGSTFNQLLIQKESLEWENDLLVTKIASASSLAQITKLSQEEGFKEPHFLYLEKQMPVALGNLTTNVAR